MAGAPLTPEKGSRKTMKFLYDQRGIVSHERLRTCAGTLATIQGLYFLATGVWPLFHIESFLAVTGPKTDLWLVQTVAALLVVAGGVLLIAAARGHVSRG